jgi:hypothetical protein
MAVNVSRQLVFLSALALFVACGKEKPAAQANSAPAAASSAPTPAAAATDCPRTGHWSGCHIKKRLEQAGLAPRDTSELADLPSVSVKPAMFMLGNAGVAYYLFPDSLARHDAASKLDSTRFIPQSKPLSMHNETTLIQNDNALVLLFSRNEHQRERVADAITAGPPQP